MTTAAAAHVVPREPAPLPELRAADQGVADALESVLSDNTRRVYGAQWRLLVEWCNEVGLVSLPAEPLTVARYLAARAGDGAAVATLRLATSAIAKAHEWAGHESPGKDRGVRAALKGWGTPAGQAPAAGRCPHRRRVVRCRVEAFRGFISHLRRCAVLGRRPRPRPRHRGPLQDRRGGPGRRGGHHLRRMRALDAIQPEGVDVKQKVFGLSESRIARRVKAIAKVAGLADIEY